MTDGPCRVAAVVLFVAFVVGCTTERRGLHVACDGRSQCICDPGAGDCTLGCKPGSCRMTCATTGVCDFKCVNGRCDIEAAAGAGTDVDCRSGGCTVYAFSKSVPDPCRITPEPPAQCEFSADPEIGPVVIDCADGGCNVTARSVGAVELRCPGGRCTLECRGATECTCDGNCAVTCADVADCS